MWWPATNFCGVLFPILKFEVQKADGILLMQKLFVILHLLV